MSRGKLNLQANDGAVVGLVVPDGLGSGERQIALGVNLSGVKAYHLLQGNLSVSNEVITNGFSTTLHTGNGSTQSVNTGIDMSTQWGNDVSETFGGLVWLKSRSIAATNNYLFDSIRGATNPISSNGTGSNVDYVTSGRTCSLSASGFSIGSEASINANLATYASWNFQTTHIKTGVTNHGKAYTCHYNPFTGFTIVKYEGSGIAGHEIPHHLGRKLGFVTVKNLSAIANWIATNEEDKYLYLNTTDAIASATTAFDMLGDVNTTVGISATVNQSIDQYIMYGWANSYYDEADKLIGNYEVGIYQGTGVAGNKVKTRGKPAWVMIKRIDGTENWITIDNQRSSFDMFLIANSTQAELSLDIIDVASDGFTLKTITAGGNILGCQYLYMVVYDNDSGSGKSKYPRATDSSQLQLNTALIPFANGIDSNGAKNTIVYKNETITGLTYTAGNNYVYAKNDGTYGVKTIAPSYGKDNPLTGDFYNVLTNKWYSNTNTEITESRNYLDAIVHADANGQVAYVEELPKIEYKDIVKANKYKGKNACTAWIVANGSVTPPIIYDEDDISSLIRTATGTYRMYFKERMDNINYSIGHMVKVETNPYQSTIYPIAKTLDYFEFATSSSSAYVNATIIDIQIFGGKN